MSQIEKDQEIAKRVLATLEESLKVAVETHNYIDAVRLKERIAGFKQCIEWWFKTESQKPPHPNDERVIADGDTYVFKGVTMMRRADGSVSVYYDKGGHMVIFDTLDDPNVPNHNLELVMKKANKD